MIPMSSRLILMMWKRVLASPRGIRVVNKIVVFSLSNDHIFLVCFGYITPVDKLILRLRALLK